LWTITLLTILITALAGQVRLSARVALFHQEELQTWAKLLSAINQAKMELVLEQMPLGVEEIAVDDLSEEAGKNPLYRYNGQELQLAYPLPEGISVRIYDHAGKINIRDLGPARMRGMLEKRLGSNATKQIDELMDAWNDWRDLDDDMGANGAEVDYYQSLAIPYKPRNSKLETVEELLQIRGFAEVFEGVDLDAAFTLYGEREQINLNLATVEAMRLLPGLDEELITQILAYRQEKEFRGNGDVAQLVPAESMALLRPWISTMATSSYFTILAYKTPAASADNIADDEEEDAPQEDESLTAFAEIVQISSFTDPPKVLKITPYQKVPIRMAVPSEDATRQ
jgi:general secretion pathway protein K